MVVKKYIYRNLCKLDSEYNKSLALPDLSLSVYFSKLATIEYCGWIEETMDAIVIAFARGKIHTNGFQDSLNTKIKETYGFQYKKHFRPMMVHVLGIIRCEKIQLDLDSNGDLSRLKSELDTYVVHRNNAAHTHINRILPTYPSPSATIGSLNRIYPILKRIYAMRKEKKYI
jgi:hypothetical protein